MQVHVFYSIVLHRRIDIGNIPLTYLDRLPIVVSSSNLNNYVKDSADIRSRDSLELPTSLTSREQLSL
jgi:hypothetical protein